MESRTSRHEESRSRNNNSPRQGPLISVVCILYFVIVYSATGLILMTFFTRKDFIDFAFVLLFAPLIICSLQIVTIFDNPTCDVKSKSKVAPEDCEQGIIVSQKFVKSHGITLGTFNNNTKITKVIKGGLKTKINPTKKSNSCPSLPILNQIQEILGEKPNEIPIIAIATNVPNDLAQIHV